MLSRLTWTTRFWLTEKRYAIRFWTVCFIVDLLPKAVKEQVVIDTICKYTVNIAPHVEMYEVRATDIMQVF